MSDIDVIENQIITLNGDGNTSVFQVKLNSSFRPDLIEISGYASNRWIVKSSLSSDLLLSFIPTGESKIKIKKFTEINTIHNFTTFNTENVQTNLTNAQQLVIVISYIRYKPRESLPKFTPQPLPVPNPKFYNLNS